MAQDSLFAPISLPSPALEKDQPGCKLLSMLVLQGTALPTLPQGWPHDFVFLLEAAGGWFCDAGMPVSHVYP